MARKMTATKVYRGGRTVRERKYETDDVKVDSGGSYRRSKEESFREKKVLTLEFSWLRRAAALRTSTFP